MAIADSQGASVYWGGRLIGRLRRVRASQGVGTSFDCTNHTSPVVGVGVNTRVLRQQDPIDILPAEVQLELIGPSPFVRDDIGRTQLLTVRTSGGTLSGDAYLRTFEAEARVGEKIGSFATFSMTGF